MKSLPSGGGAVYTLDFDAAGKHVLGTTADGAFRAINIETAAATVVDPGVGWGYHTWDVSRDGRLIAGPGKGGIVVWDQKTFKEVRVLPGNAGGVSFVALSPDGRTVASTGSDGAVRLWDVKKGEQIGTPGDGLGAGRLRFSENGRRLLVWGQDRQIHVYGPSRDGRVPAKKPVAPAPPVIEDPDD